MTIKNQYRDVTLQEINESDIGRELRVAGWIENIRDHGGVSFVDLRDMYGVLRTTPGFPREPSSWKRIKWMCLAGFTDSFPLRL